MLGIWTTKVIFHKPLKQWLVCFPKVILLGVWAEGIYESDFSRPRERLYVLNSVFLLAPIFSSVAVFHTASGINLTVIRNWRKDKHTDTHRGKLESGGLCLV